MQQRHFDLVVEKAVEVGVKTAVPLIAARTVKLNLKMERIRKIMKEAAEQCGRGIVPTLELARQHDLKLATLGPLVFRAETAAIVASFLAIQHRRS